MNTKEVKSLLENKGYTVSIGDVFLTISLKGEEIFFTPYEWEFIAIGKQLASTGSFNTKAIDYRKQTY